MTERIESALTYDVMCKMPFLTLAKIVNSEVHTPEDRLKAANAFRMRAGGEMNGAGWLAMGFDDKAAVRKALTYDTTGEGFQAIS